MFNSARIKLTSWYLMIIMFISISFSLVIYGMVASELDRVERIQRLRIERRLPDQSDFLPPSQRVGNEMRPFLFLDPELINEAKNRLMLILITINFGILGASAGAGYFLAGRTLKPIKEMVDEQNRFISDASHELRTPLTSLKSEIEVNLRDEKLTLFQTKKLLKSNLEEVNNLQILSDGLIKLNQYQRGGNGLISTNVSLAAIVNEAIKKIAMLAKNKNIMIISKIDNFHIEGNKQTLIELFVIFLDNAIKYSTENKKVKLISEKTNNYIVVHIEDQGIGMNEEDLSHIFDRFYRVDKSRTKSEIPGYGLGLSIAKQIVGKYRGFIKVKSKPNGGSVFTIYFSAIRSHGLI